MYERQLEELRTKLGEITRDRTQLQLATTKNTGLITELQTRWVDNKQTQLAKLCYAFTLQIVNYQGVAGIISLISVKLL